MSSSLRSTAPRPAPLLSDALARLAVCGATLMLVLPVVIHAQQPRTLARAAALRAAAPSAPTAARDLPRGHVLAAADIASGDGNSSTLDARRATLVGWTTRRVIQAGEVLREPSVVPSVTSSVGSPNVVSAVSPGQRVALVWRDAAVEVRLAGIAAGAASVGSRVAVRVDQRRRFEGTVIAPGVVRLP